MAVGICAPIIFDQNSVVIPGLLFRLPITYEGTTYYYCETTGVGYPVSKAPVGAVLTGIVGLQ